MTTKLERRAAELAKANSVNTETEHYLRHAIIQLAREHARKAAWSVVDATHLGTDPSDTKMMQALQYVDAALAAAEGNENDKA